MVFEEKDEYNNITTRLLHKIIIYND